MLLTLSRGPQIAFAVSVLTLVLASITTVFQPAKVRLEVPDSSAFPVASLRPRAPTVVASEEQGLWIDGAAVRYKGMHVMTVDELRSDAARLVEVMRGDGWFGRADRISADWKLLVRHRGDAPEDVLDAARSAAQQAGFDDVIVVVDGDHTQLLADL